MNFTPTQLTNSGKVYLAFPGEQGPEALYRLATWGNYYELATTRRQIITNIEEREKVKIQIVSNKQKTDPMPLVLAGAGLLIGGFVLGVLAAK